MSLQESLVRKVVSELNEEHIDQLLEKIKEKEDAFFSKNSLDQYIDSAKADDPMLHMFSTLLTDQKDKIQREKEAEQRFLAQKERARIEEEEEERQRHHAANCFRSPEFNAFRKEAKKMDAEFREFTTTRYCATVNIKLELAGTVQLSDDYESHGTATDTIFGNSQLHESHFDHFYHTNNFRFRLVNHQELPSGLVKAIEQQLDSINDDEICEDGLSVVTGLPELLHAKFEALANLQRKVLAYCKDNGIDEDALTPFADPEHVMAEPDVTTKKT